MESSVNISNVNIFNSQDKAISIGDRLVQNLKIAH